MASRDVTGRIIADTIEWERGLCRGNYSKGEDDIWFSSTPTQLKEAREICATCPIIDDCRTYAIDHEQYFGVWGGMSEAELRRTVKDAKKKPQQCELCGDLFHNRYSSAYCGDDCRTEAAKEAKRTTKTGYVPVARELEWRTA